MNLNFKMKRDEILIFALITLLTLSLLTGVVNIFKGSFDSEKSVEGIDTDEAAEIIKEITKGVTSSSGKGVAVLKIYGVISFVDDGQMGFPVKRGADAVVRRINRYRDDDRVQALVLRINSPGGTIGASHEIYTAVKEFQEAGKKVVVSMADVAASGGYYISASADLIMANPGTMTGSIGVIMSGLNVRKLLRNGESMLKHLNQESIRISCQLTEI